MKNSKLRRILLLVACAVLLVSLSVGATLAYLTSTTGTVTNTFTVGNVNITLDEAKVDAYGKPDGDKRTTDGNEYKLLPGHTYTKDPTVTVVKGSEPCYVRIKVTVTNVENLMNAIPEYKHTDAALGTYFNLAALVDGWQADEWAFKTIHGTNVYEFRYNGIVDARDAEQKLPALFTAIKIPGHLNETQLGMLKDVKIGVQAFAIQADGFNGDVDAAWTAFDGQK